MSFLIQVYMFIYMEFWCTVVFIAYFDCFFLVSYGRDWNEITYAAHAQRGQLKQGITKELFWKVLYFFLVSLNSSCYIYWKDCSDYSVMVISKFL